MGGWVCFCVVCCGQLVAGGRCCCCCKELSLQLLVGDVVGVAAVADSDGDVDDNDGEARTREALTLYGQLPAGDGTSLAAHRHPTVLAQPPAQIVECTGK